jgi:hypothetical protein
MEHKIDSVIRTNRKDQFILKLICKSIPIAEEMAEDLTAYKDTHKEAFEKMQVLYGLRSLEISTVNHQVFVLYKFGKTQDTKEFERSFIKYIDETGSNILETFMITEATKEGESERNEFNVTLKLPPQAKDALRSYESLYSVTLSGFPRIHIYRDELQFDGKFVSLHSKDLNSDILEIFYFIGKEKIIREVPQKWLDISEITYKAIVNVSWASNPKNIVQIINGAFVSRFEDREILVPLDVMQMDGLKVELIKNGDKYVNLKNREQVFEPEMLLFR